MARFGSLGTQYFDNSGDPLIDGLIYFYEPGTTSEKNTFSDVNETIPNTNPVVLSASGRQPNIFFSGSAKAVLATSANVTIETRDPVGLTSIEGQFDEWSAAVIYPINDIVARSGAYFISLTNDNQGFDPDISPTKWTELDFIRLWNADETYQVNSLAKGADGIIYRGTSANNLNNNPVSDITGENWLAAGQKLTTKGSILAGDGTKALPLAVGAEGTVPKSRAAAALGIAWEPEGSNTIAKEERSANTILSISDSGKLIKITSGTFSQTFDDVAALTNGWFVYYQNSGTGLITLDPDAAELIDGLASYVMYPGELRLIQCDGTKLTTIVLNAFEYDFDSSGTFTKPPGYRGFAGYVWGGGGGGLASQGAGGGAACVPFDFKASSFSATETITIAAGGASGAVGGNSLLGALVTAFGGGPAASGVAGGGGGLYSAGAANAAGNPSDGGVYGGGTPPVGVSVYGGGAGSDSAISSGGRALWGGGGGGGSATGVNSVYGGKGGTGANNGEQPGGGGGYGATTGGAGRIRIRGVF